MTKRRIPTYRFHKASGQAVVVLAGRSIYLGRYGSPESKTKYDRVIAGYLADRADPDKLSRPSSARNVDPPGAQADELTVAELVLRYWQFAKSYYVKYGRPTGEIHPLKQVLRLLRVHFGDAHAADFGPRSLKRLRDALLTRPITRRVKLVDQATNETRFEEKLIRTGLARRTINKQISRVKRVFAWAVAEELMSANVHEALRRVDGLRKGRSAAREIPPVRPVADAHIEAVLPHVSPTIRAMIEVHRLTGCRPQELVAMRGSEIDTTSPVWEYRPRVYKTEHRNESRLQELDRVIYIGPRAQAILQPLLRTARQGYLFRPKHAGVSTPGTSNTWDSKVDGGSGHYSVAAYRQEVRRGCDRAGVPRWVPLQLRHSVGTRIRKRFGLESAQAVLGHRELGVTQVYAEVDREAAQNAMAEIG